MLTDFSECEIFSWGESLEEFEDLSILFKMEEARVRYSKGSKPWYVGWENCDKKAVDILRSYYGHPFFMPANAKIFGRPDWIFIGTPGYGAPSHIDNVEYPSWQVQVLIDIIDILVIALYS